MIYSTQYILRLCRTQIILQKRFTQVSSTTGVAINKLKQKPYTESDSLKTLLEKYKDKIRFNSYLDSEKLELGAFKYHLKLLKEAKRNQRKEYNDKTLPPLPLALQYYVDKDKLLKTENDKDSKQDADLNNTFQLPFASGTKLDIQQEEQQPQATVEEYDRGNVNKWMTNYEHFDDSQLRDESDDEALQTDWFKNYGTADPSARISRVPCGGCGALLHCNDPAIPGYLPSEIFKERMDNELKTMECQRCHFLKEYNIALDVSVQPEEYEKLLQSIKHVKSLVILMVDLLDFPCSIWPGIVDIIGTQRPIIIVGNKVDLLPGDSFGYLKRIRESLSTEISKTRLSEANIKHISLISAKTGYGVEDLISVMFKEWLCKGDVFLVGCTNVGKSSLFNALIQSDYCKVHAVDIVRRATVSRWPGTTLNLLKFPINRISGWKIYQRTRRLKSEAKLMQVEKEIRRAQVKGKTVSEGPSLIGHIGRTFSDPALMDEDLNLLAKQKQLTLNEKDEVFAKSKWFYDTPGVIHPDQVLSLLTTEELLVTIPKKMIKPQTYYLREGSTIFIGGLARLDLVKSQEAVRLTIFCAETLPITVTDTINADEVYDEFLGTEIFAAPTGGEERLKNWPGLEMSKEVMEFEGQGPKMCCGDVVLSSVAWVAMTVKGGSTCGVVGWTPRGRGIHRRYPSLLQYAVNLKGMRVRDTPAYMIGKVFNEE